MPSILFTTDHCLALAPKVLRHINVPFTGDPGQGRFWRQVIAPGENSRYIPIGQSWIDWWDFGRSRDQHIRVVRV